MIRHGAIAISAVTNAANTHIFCLPQVLISQVGLLHQRAGTVAQHNLMTRLVPRMRNLLTWSPVASPGWGFLFWLL